MSSKRSINTALPVIYSEVVENGAQLSGLMTGLHQLSVKVGKLRPKK
jgi:hypothetical protein